MWERDQYAGRSAIDSRVAAGSNTGTEKGSTRPRRLDFGYGAIVKYGMSSIESVHCRGKRYDLLPGTFYHLTPRDDVGRILFWNARLGEGLLASSSVLAADDGMGEVGTPYYFANRRNPKELLWETIREQEFPTLPTDEGIVLV